MEKENEKHWIQLTHRYAICTRKLSEAAGKLSGHRMATPETRNLWGEIIRLSALCVPIAEEIERYFEDTEIAHA